MATTHTGTGPGVASLSTCTTHTVMLGQDEPPNIDRVFGFLREWDRGNDSVRKRMLVSFVRQNSGKTFSDLDLQCPLVSSLFLARLSTNLRLTCVFGTCLDLQLRAVKIFLSASDRDQYLREFVEHGGVLTLLDILSLPNIKEKDKAHAVQVLLIISKSGPRFREIICECEGVKAITAHLSQSRVSDAHKTFSLLQSLLHASAKHHQQTFDHLVKLLSCCSDKVQQVALQSLLALQGHVTPGHRLVEPLLDALTSLNTHVQGEAVHLTAALVDHEVGAALLSGLLDLLQPPEDTPCAAEEKSENTTRERVFVAAARATRLLCQKSHDVSAEFLTRGVVERLLLSVGDRRRHVDSQMEASLTLKHFVDHSPGVRSHVSRAMGAPRFEAFTSKAEDPNMDVTEAEKLQKNELDGGDTCC